MLSPTSSPSPARPAVPPAPASAPASRRSSVASRGSANNNPLSPAMSPRALFRPTLSRATTLAAAGGAMLNGETGIVASAIPPVVDPFQQGATIAINQPIGSLSISPSSRDVCLASRKGLYILDVDNLEQAPRFVPQGGTWQIADVQWSPHAVTDNLILSTSSQKLLVWDLAAQVELNRSIEAHDRAITDINWHTLNPNMMATVGMDAAVRGWDLRHDCRRPAVRLSAWGAAGTQVKWNRRNENILATAHHREILIWDIRKGSVPVETIQAHDAKIYGIDWDRIETHKLVTCSLDKTIKFWSVPSLSEGKDDGDRPYHYEVISTSYPVWRARHLPFGSGVLALPQRHETALEMFGVGGDVPLERFEGASGVVKEFVWRIRGGQDRLHEDREFQLVTWSKDGKLRIWPMSKDTVERAGYKAGAPIPYRSSRLGAKNRTFTHIPGKEGTRGIPQAGANMQSPAPLLNPMSSGPSGIARQRLLAHTPRGETGMTRGGGKATSRKIDQLEWLTKVMKTTGAESGARSESGSGTQTPSMVAGDIPSRSRSRSGSLRDRFRPLSAQTRTPSRIRGERADDSVNELMPLKDEVLLVHKRFPKSKVNFEKLDLARRKLTMSMNGPWANGDRFAFIRIHWAFPPKYPYGPEIPTFELERNATVSQITRQRMVSTIREMRAANKQCLVSVTEFLLGYHERTGRRVLDEDSGSEDESFAQNAPMLIRTTGAVFGPNGQLACFFPKQTILPRARTSLSRSPNGTHDPLKSPLARAISALSRMENPNKPAVSLRYRRHVRRLKAMLAPVQQRSVVALRNVSALLNEPDMSLAAVYSTISVDTNLVAALDGKRLDHAEVWATLRGVLSDPPPPYSDLPMFHSHSQMPHQRLVWEADMERKRRVLDELFERLMDAADVQLLALVACILQEYDNAAPPPPPQMESIIQRSPEVGYFALPPDVPINPPNRRHSSLTTPTTPPPASGPSSFRTSGWSQILMNPSSISLRGMALTPRDRTSFDIPNRTSIGSSLDEHGIPSPGRRVAIPRRDSTVGASATQSAFAGSLSNIAASPRLNRRDSRELSRTMSRDFRPRPLSQTYTSSPPTTAVPPTPSRLYASTTAGSAEPSSDGSGGPGMRHKVSFGSGSPLRRQFTRSHTLLPTIKRRTPTCSVRIDLQTDNDPPATLLRPELRPLAEVWKLAYADFLLRAGLVGRRTVLLQYEFAPVEGPARDAASGDIAHGELQLANVCRSCGERALGPDDVRCTHCERFKLPPLCAVCRLPIKGLSTTCTVCAHTSHTRCLRSVLTGPTDHCPACMCQCLAERGLSGGFPTTAKTLAPTAISYGFAPLQGPRDISPTLLEFDGPHSGMPSPPLLHTGNMHGGGLGDSTSTVGGGQAGNEAWWGDGAGVGAAMLGGDLGLDTSLGVVDSPMDEMRVGVGLSGLGPQHPSRRATYAAPDSEHNTDRDDAPHEENTAQGLLARTRLRTFGGESGILGW